MKNDCLINLQFCNIYKNVFSKFFNISCTLKVFENSRQQVIIYVFISIYLSPLGENFESQIIWYLFMTKILVTVQIKRQNQSRDYYLGKISFLERGGEDVHKFGFVFGFSALKLLIQKNISQDWKFRDDSFAVPQLTDAS